MTAQQVFQNQKEYLLDLIGRESKKESIAEGQGNYLPRDKPADQRRTAAID